MWLLGTERLGAVVRLVVWVLVLLLVLLVVLILVQVLVPLQVPRVVVLVVVLVVSRQRVSAQELPLVSGQSPQLPVERVLQRSMCLRLVLVVRLLVGVGSHSCTHQHL